MAIRYEKLFALLDEKGYNYPKIRETGLIGQGTLTRIKHGVGGMDMATLNRICTEFRVQPNDIMEWVPDEDIPDSKPTVIEGLPERKRKRRLAEKGEKQD